MKTPPVHFRRAGFTLLELVISIGLLSIVIGMVLGIARTSLALGQTIVKTQNEEMINQAFVDLLSQRFASMPGNARLELKVERSGAHYLSDLTLQNIPLAFTWGGEERIAKAVRLSTVKRRSGYLDIVLSYYEKEILKGAESNFGNSASPEKPFAQIVLLSDVAYFEWRALDGRSMEWSEDWQIEGRLPLQLELIMSIGAKGEEMRQVFWLPPKQNPQLMMRQLLGAGANPNRPNPDGQPIDDGSKPPENGGSNPAPEIAPGGVTPERRNR